LVVNVVESVAERERMENLKFVWVDLIQQVAKGGNFSPISKRRRLCFGLLFQIFCIELNKMYEF
jgi:hypothetical protein